MASDRPLVAGCIEIMRNRSISCLNAGCGTARRWRKRGFTPICLRRDLVAAWQPDLDLGAAAEHHHEADFAAIVVFIAGAFDY